MALTTVGDTPYFNPRAPCGARPEAYQDAIAPLNFNPRAPCGARQGAVWLYRRDALYFNPRAPCGARPYRGHNPQCGKTISIHAPLAGRDWEWERPAPAGTFQSTRPLRGATDIKTLDKNLNDLFQSTRPLRGATDTESRSFAHDQKDFNPRAPCGARLTYFFVVFAHSGISIHAPLAGRDVRVSVLGVQYAVISIHAPLAGRDD